MACSLPNAVHAVRGFLLRGDPQAAQQEPRGVVEGRGNMLRPVKKRSVVVSARHVADALDSKQNGFRF
jgi:hypothetical protein